MLPATPPPSFYEPPPDSVAGAPGTVIDRLELGAPAGARAWAVLYRSTGIDDRPCAVSGLIVSPARWSGSAPIIAWAHGTTGIADACAPSRSALDSDDRALMAELARLGFVVTASDYEGLGTPGLHPYMVGTSEGRSVLDSIRAAAALDDSSPQGSSPAGPDRSRAPARAAIIGVSQGGHAALWSAELQPRYAPDIDLVGVVAASPPMVLRSVQDAVFDATPTADEVGPQAALWLETLLVVAAWHQLLGAPIDGLLTAEGRAIVGRLAAECPWDLPAPALKPFLVDPRTLRAWQALLEANSPGHTASLAPILVLAATADELIAPSTIPLGVERLRGAGSSVELRWIEGGHTATIADPASVALALGWITARFRGDPVAAPR